MPHPPTGTSASLSRNDSLPAATSDPEADYSTFRRRRLTAEEIRDSLLAVTGELDLVPGEGHPFPPEEKWGFTQHGPFAADYDTLKRSVYVMMKRNKRHPFFALFDGADPNASTPVRDRTTVPTQSLYFMNDPFLHARAAKLAGMAMASATGETARAEWLVRRVMGRAATRQDLREASTFLHDYATACADQPASTRPALAWAAYARVLLASNEFLHID
ncbi:MAG TPA: hypothetical protein DCM86_05020 [Verrucomicrobiales bacterium]|nr:hypothetical protein [Verrucomicrobiales bacterium]